MTLGMQIRLWFRQATARQRQAVVGGLAVLALVAMATVVVRPDDGAATAIDAAAAAGGPLPTMPSGGGAAAPGVEAASGPAVAGDASAPQVGGAPAAPGASDAASGQGATASQASGSSPAVALEASDRGISETEIKIGFIVANVGGLDGAGFALDIRDDADDYSNALAAYANAHGGVLGRQVTAAVRATDPTNQSDQAAACRAMTSDHKVFGVVDTGAISDTPAMQCIAIDNEMPFVHNTIWGTDWLARSKGLEVGYPAAIDRLSQTWVRDVVAMGWLPKDAVVGILGDKCAAASPTIDNVLKPLIVRAGASKVVVEKHDCDPSSVAAQPPSFVTRFRAEGVTHVFVASNFVSNAVFMNAAETQGYRPKYTVSDWWQVSSDASAKNYPADHFDGAIAITSLGMVLPQSGRGPWPGWERCNQVAIDAGLPPLEHQSRHHELFALCDNFFLLIDGLTAAGPNPSRWDWAAAIENLGDHPSVMFGPSRFVPGKVTGSDMVFTARWQRDCTCYKAISDMRPAAA